jgi:hypothetical protein
VVAARVRVRRLPEVCPGARVRALANLNPRRLMSHHLNAVEHIDRAMHDCISDDDVMRECAETRRRCSQSCRAMAA